MTKGNGHATDEGLQAIKEAFTDAQYLDPNGKECANLMMIGAHREQEIPDNLIMEVYATITSGRNVRLEFTSDEGNGYVACIEGYEDLINLMQGTLEAMPLRADS